MYNKIIIKSTILSSPLRARSTIVETYYDILIRANVQVQMLYNVVNTYFWTDIARASM